jgi:SSS family solute:Na+ symporter
MLAALMSSLASAFNSCSTLLTWDVYRKLRPNASEARLVEVGRASTVILVGLGLAWIPLMKYISPQLYIYLQSVQAYIAPPIAACFLFGVMSKRLTAPAAVTTLLIGFVLGALRLGLELGKRHLTPGGVGAWYAGINFLHFAALLFLLSTGILVVVSFATAAPSAAQVEDLTMQTTTVSPVSAEATDERRRNIVASVVLAGVIGVLWIVFR